MSIGILFPMSVQRCYRTDYALSPHVKHVTDLIHTRSFQFKPNSRTGKAGYVYKLGLRNGKANIDEYAPIYTPEEFKTDGDKYEGDLKLAVVAILGIIGSGALAILLTSSL